MPGTSNPIPIRDIEITISSTMDTVRSYTAMASRVCALFGVNCRERGFPGSCCMLCTHRPVDTSHKRTLQSSLPVRK